MKYLFLINQSKDLYSFGANWKLIYRLDWVWRQLNTRSLRNKNVALSCLFMCSLRTLGEWDVTDMANLTYPPMRSLPQVVFTAAFLKCPTPVVVCLYILSAALELCSSVLPPNLVKRELDISTTLSLDFLSFCESKRSHMKTQSDAVLEEWRTNLEQALADFRVQF